MYYLRVELKKRTYMILAIILESSYDILPVLCGVTTALHFYYAERNIEGLEIYCTKKLSKESDIWVY